MSKTVNIAGVFTTPYPPLTYTSDHASVTFSGDDMRLAPLAAEVREVTVTATDALGQKASTTFTLNSRGLLQTVASGEVRDNHYVEVDGRMVRTTLLEPAATNLFLYSEDFSQWSSNGVALTTGYADPNGGLSATLIEASSANSFVSHNAPDAPTTEGTVYTLSAWLRSETGDPLKLLAYDGTTSYQSPVITPTPEWKRYTFTFTLGPNATSVRGYIGGATSFGVGESVIAWGAQLEAGSIPSSYIPVHGTPATRVAEGLLIPAETGGTGAVTLYAKFRYLGTGEPVFQIGSSDTARIRYRLAAEGRFRTEIYNGGGGAVHGAWGDHSLAAGTTVEIIMRVDPVGGTISWQETRNGVEVFGVTQTFAGFTTLRENILTYNIFGLTHAVELYSGAATDLATARTNRGDLFSYRPGDPLPEGASSRASAAIQNAPAPADLPSPPEGWVFAFPDEAYPGGRVPVRDHEGTIVGTVVQGVDDAVGTSDPAITREGWSLDGDDSLRIDLLGDLDVARTASDVAIALTTSDGACTLLNFEGAREAAVWDGTNADSSRNLGASALIFLDGTARPTRSDLRTAITDGAPHMVRGARLDLSASFAMTLSNSVGGYGFSGTVHALALHLSDTEATAESRAAAHAYVQARLALHGVTLPDLP